MLPLLRLAADGKGRSLAEGRDLLAAEFGLSAAERDELLPSGRQSRFGNRVAWAKVYLQQAALLLSPRRGHFQISDRGRELLTAPPERIDIKFLDRYPEFVRSRKGEVGGESPTELETPEEALETAHMKMRAGLASEVLGRVKAGSDKFFERLVVELLLKMGYGGPEGGSH